MLTITNSKSKLSDCQQRIDELNKLYSEKNSQNTININSGLLLKNKDSSWHTVELYDSGWIKPYFITKPDEISSFAGNYYQNWRFNFNNIPEWFITGVESAVVFKDSDLRTEYFNIINQTIISKSWSRTPGEDITKFNYIYTVSVTNFQEYNTEDISLDWIEMKAIVYYKNPFMFQ